MRLAVIDLDLGRIVDMEGQVLVGKCNRCGACCRMLGCDRLVVDFYEDHEHTKPVWKCINKPFDCVVYPLPEHPRPATCGLRWERKR